MRAYFHVLQYNAIYFSKGNPGWASGIDSEQGFAPQLRNLSEGTLLSSCLSLYLSF